MAFRKFDTGFWHNAFVEPLSKEAKLLYIYLWTNDNCNQAGIYEITKKRILFDCGLDIDKYAPELSKSIAWFSDDNIIWVRSFFKEQCQNEKFAISVINSLKSISPKYAKAYILYNQELLESYGIDTISILRMSYGDERIPTISVLFCSNIYNNINNKQGEEIESKNLKKKHLDCVTLSDEEYQKLIKRFGQEVITKAIEKLNNWKMAKGKKTKSDYHTLLGWPTEQVVLETQAKGGSGALKPTIVTHSYFEPVNCKSCGKRILIKTDLTETGCVYCPSEAANA